MTNRKFKDYAKNKVVYDCIVENFRNLSRIMLTLHKLYPKTFYPKVIGEWLNTYADNCREMDKYDEAGVYDFKMGVWCEEYGINEKWCIDFCTRNNPTIKHPQNIIVLANNIKLALVQTCMEFGIGDKRLAEIRAALDTEADRILSAIPKGAAKIALCVEGKQYDSPALASLIGKYNDECGKIALIIGSSHGLSEKVKRECAVRLSFSQLTFPHQLMRVILYEALYRSFTILAGKRYHK